MGAFLKVPEAIQTPGSDTGIYATYGQLLLRGARPYVDFWDIHPPLVFAYWMLVDALTGPDWLRTCFTITGLAPQSCTGSMAHVFDLGLSVAAALMAALIARRAGLSVVGVALAALLVVGFAEQSIMSMEGSNPSKLTLLPSTLALWAYVRSVQGTAGARSWALVAGVAAAIATLTKQPALLTFAALALHALWGHHRAHLIALVSGAATTFAVVSAALLAVGSLDGFIAQVWAYNLERSLAGYFINPPKEPSITLKRVLTEGAGMLAGLGMAGGVLLAVRPRHARQPLLVWWSAVNLLAVVAFREFVYVVPGLALLSACALDRAWRWIGNRGVTAAVLGRAVLVALCVVALVSTTSFQQVQLARARAERGPGGGLSQPEELGRILRKDFAQGPLFVYGNAAELYPISGRAPATAYLNAEALRISAPAADQTRATVVLDLQRKPPPVIVLPPHADEHELDPQAYPALRWFLQACYRRRPINARFDRNWTVLVPTRDCGRIDRS